MKGLNYRLEGRGPLLVLLHEMGGSLESWNETAALLTGDFTILRYDQRGAGQSDKPRAMLTLDEHIADLSELLTQLNLPLPVRLCGVAAGAAIAIGFALQKPAAVAKLVLCAPALSVAPDRRQYLEDRAVLVGRDGMAAVADMSLDNSYPALLRRRDAAAYESYRARFLANDPACYGNANRLLAITDLEPRLPQLGMPCLVLSGRHDGMRPPEEGRRIAAQIPGAHFDSLDSGHLMSVQAGVELARRLRAFFLA